jgi:hypothetical protein
VCLRLFVLYVKLRNNISYAWGVAGLLFFVIFSFSLIITLLHICGNLISGGADGISSVLDKEDSCKLALLRC